MLGPGARLGPYEIQSAIGAGGMGEVYKAKDIRLDRSVAIKVLPTHVSGDPALRERFEREARTVAALSHPHICTLHDVGHQEGTDFLVMEYLEGETLAQRLTKGALPIDQALSIAIQVADALDKAHRAGIVHRDLKPGNIMLTKSGAKLLDFGLAKVTSAAVAASGLSMAPTGVTPVTMQGTILGTLQYMAPEQVDGREADARSDIFAFGAIVYEMVTGKRTFEGKSQASVIAAILEREPPVMSSVQPLTPNALDHVVQRCLMKDSDERWRSVADVKHELTWIAAAPLTIASHRESVRGLRPLRLLVAAALLLVAAMGLVVAFVLWRSIPPRLVTRLDVNTPATTDGFSFALSPDGRLIAFAANGDKGSQLWFRRLDQATGQPLPGTEGASNAFWSPDGRSLAFFADAKLKRLDLNGGAPQVLADAPQPRGGTWNAAGIIVFAPASTSPLMRIDAAGGTAAPATRLSPGQVSHRWPQFLPDGRQFLFLSQLGQGQTWGVYVGTLEGGEPTRLLSSDTEAKYAQPGYLLRVSQGALLAQPFDAMRATLSGEPVAIAQGVGPNDGTGHSAFSVSSADILAYRPGSASLRQLVWMDRTGHTIGKIGGPDQGQPANLALAPDGQRVAVNRVQANIDVWLLDAKGVATQFTFNDVQDTRPVWSPDGGRIVFVRTGGRSGGDLWEKTASGETAEQPLLVDDHQKTSLDWSRDGRYLLYSSEDPKTASDLWALQMIGERKSMSIVRTSFDETEGQFSPDGRLIAYASNESGRYETYVRSFPESGGKWRVSTNGGTQPRWSPDGKALYYIAPDNRLMSAAIQTTADGRAVQVSTPEVLFPVRLAAGTNIAIGSNLARAQYAVAPDGRFLMITPTDEAVTSPISIVLNWDAALSGK